MAVWPFARRTTYVSASVPAIAAADLNAMQDAIAEIANGTFPRIGATNQSDDLPIAQFFDKSNNLRWLVDHNGYPMGRRSEFREEWCCSISTQTQSSPSPITNLERWVVSGANAEFQLANLDPATASYPASVMSLQSFVGTHASSLTTAAYLLNTNINGLSAVLEFDARVSDLTNASQYFAGLLGGASTIAFKSPAAGGNWQCFVTGSADADSGVAAAIDTWYRFRLEVHNTGSPFGAACRFFINGSLVATISSAPADKYKIEFLNTSNGTIATNLWIGPVLMSWNRQTTVDAL